MQGTAAVDAAEGGYTPQQGTSEASRRRGTPGSRGRAAAAAAARLPPRGGRVVAGGSSHWPGVGPPPAHPVVASTPAAVARGEGGHRRGRPPRGASDGGVVGAAGRWAGCGAARRSARAWPRGRAWPPRARWGWRGGARRQRWSWRAGTGGRTSGCHQRIGRGSAAANDNDGGHLLANGRGARVDAPNDQRRPLGAAPQEQHLRGPLPRPMADGRAVLGGVQEGRDLTEAGRSPGRWRGEGGGVVVVAARGPSAGGHPLLVGPRRGEGVAPLARPPRRRTKSTPILAEATLISSEVNVVRTM